MNQFLLSRILLCIFWYKIIIHCHEGTHLLMSSGACFHDLVYKSGNEMVFCDNIGCKAQTHKRNVWIHSSWPEDCSIFFVHDYYKSSWSYGLIIVLWGLFSWFCLKIWKLEGCMWKYWLQSSNTLEKDMNILFSTSRILCFLIQDYHSSWWSYRLISVLLGLFSWLHLKIWKWEGSMQKYWLRSSITLENSLNRFFLIRRLLCIFVTRLSYILITPQTHQCPLGPVFIIIS